MYITSLGCVRAVGRDLYNVGVKSEVLEIRSESLGSVVQEHVRFRLHLTSLDLPPNKQEVRQHAPLPGGELMTWDIGNRRSIF